MRRVLAALVLVVLVPGRDAAAATGPVVVPDLGGWMSVQRQARAVLVKTNRDYADPLKACSGWERTATDKALAPPSTAFVTGLLMVEGFLAAPSGDFGPLSAAVDRVKGLNLPDRMEGGKVVAAAERLAALQGVQTIDEWSEAMQFLAAVFQDHDPVEGLAFLAGVEVARLFGSLEVADRPGAADGVAHLRVLRDLAGEKRGRVEVLVDGILEVDSLEAQRLRNALGAGCSVL